MYLPQVQEDSRRQAEERRQQALDRKDLRQQKAAAKAEAESQPMRDLSPASIAHRTRQRWQASGIVSLRDLELTELPDLSKDWDELGPAATARVYAVDVGNNLLSSLPGELLTSCPTPWPLLCALACGRRRHRTHLPVPSAGMSAHC